MNDVRLFGPGGALGPEVFDAVVPWMITAAFEPVEESVRSITLDPHMIRWRDVASAVFTASPEDLLWAVSSFIPSAVYADWLAARRKDDEKWRDEVRQVVGILRDDRLARLERETVSRWR